MMTNDMTGNAGEGVDGVADENRVLIFDTTLRDGEQAPGYSMTPTQKLKMAHLLAEMGVDIMEAGFAAASPGDFEAVNRVAKEVEGPVICSLARGSQADIIAAGKAIAPAKKNRIHIFIATSPVHREFKLQKTKAEIVQDTAQSIRAARDWTDQVEFSPEDAIRTERDYLAEVCGVAIEAGATTINIPDTVGYTTTEEIFDLFTFLRTTVPGMDKVRLSTHCHNDLGMAVANSLAAVRAGARQVECTINGIGERAGNASLEEVVMALKVRGDYFKYTTNIDSCLLYPASKLLCTLTGNAIARNKAVVGANAFAHEAGIHQHGMLQNKETYEIMKPEDIGIPMSSLVLGKHSGKHALAARARDMGFELSDNELKHVFVAFKELADKKKEVLDSDIEALILGTATAPEGPWRLVGLHVSTGFGSGALPYAAIELMHEDGGRQREAATGDGPLDAVFNAIKRVTGVHADLEDLHIRNVTAGEDAQGEADVRARYEGRSYHGHGVSTDVVAAGAEAFLAVVNQVFRANARRTASEAQEAASA